MVSSLTRVVPALAVAVLASGAAQAAPKDEMALVTNAPFQSVMQVRGQRLPLSGRMSLYLSATPEQLKAGQVRAKGVNFVLDEVSQEAITGRKPQGRAKAALGLALRHMGNQQHILKYDDRTLVIDGKLPIAVDFPQLDELIPPRREQDSKDGDTYRPNSQKGFLRFSVKLETPLSEAARSDRATVRASAGATLDTEPLQDGGVTVSSYQLAVSRTSLTIQTAYLLKFEVARSLCVQPVRVKSSATDASPTGAGLGFGMPGAREQWNKADITFTVRAWKEVVSSNWKTPATDARENELRASVQDSDCIEIFFVQNFSPESKYGGGATWGSGTASAQIISSDGNAVGGIDLTHLAHELGHVVNFKHPGTSATGMVTASTGTLLCPSGWRNDNPRINSEFNADNASNPLLTFGIKVRTAAPDCENDADCGACP